MCQPARDVLLQPLLVLIDADSGGGVPAAAGGSGLHVLGTQVVVCRLQQEGQGCMS